VMSDSPKRHTERVRPRKSLGQHWLKDQSIIHKIVSVAAFSPTSHVLEVGPGRGALTIPLAALVGHLYAVEKDERLAERLEGELQKRAITNVTVLRQDILRTRLEELWLPPGEKLGVIANLPYNISTPFLEKLLENKARVGRAVLMFQMEVARRMVASPGNKEYGSLSVLLQYHARLEPLLEVSRKAFYPVPKVDSMVLGLDFDRPHGVRAPDEEQFKRVVRAAFSHRRKTLLNSLRGSLCAFSTEELKSAFEACRIDGGMRAETLGIDAFICLSAHLPAKPLGGEPKRRLSTDSTDGDCMP
jgi:16S rRNA (adenine1518-N6/adenine1519-N6)-dimethyltransferase